ncbi:MAG: RagB/SusD family nutrient uptake outer membrane protein [Paludibacteraceae bacterium]|nr:RagB/SusD family nutrient uptake outer membrane protein [Paludibacteraceae bacterium]
MKKIAFFICLGVAALTTSCSDVLEEEVYGQPTAQEMLANQENVARVVGQAYADVKWLHDHWGYWGINTLSSDECINPIRQPGNDWNDDGYWKGFNDQSWTPSDLSFEFVWQYSNSGAVLCNKIIQQLETEVKGNLEDDVYNRFVAELKCLRSYYYYTLFDAFGRIPYLETYSAENVPQSEPYEVWAKLVNTLEEVGPMLPKANVPSKAANYGRATHGMAYALLARLYLNAESYGVTPANAKAAGVAGINSEADFYTKCVKACDEVINSKVYKIEPDFFTNFLIHNEVSEENIFVIVEDGNADFDYRDVSGKMANKLRITMLTLNYKHQQAWNLSDKTWNGFSATPSFLKLYEYQVDRRGPCDSIKGTKDEGKWGWFLGPVYGEDGNILIMDDKGNLEAHMTSNVTSLEEATPNDGARLLKYEVGKGSPNKFCDNDFVLFRYADVLYMKAEAILRDGEGDLAALLQDSEFQLIRSRAGVTPYASLDLDELLDERGREFAWENIRRRDLIRYKKFSQGEWTFKPVREKYLDWFPIPRKMIETSGGLWTQNDGYSTDE